MTRLPPALRSRLLHPTAHTYLRDIRHGKPGRARPAAAEHIMLFRADVEQTSEVQVLRLRGELDIAGVEILAQVLSCERQIAAGRGAELLVDMSAVTFIDRAALTVMLEARDSSEAEGQVFTVGPTSAPVRRLLELSAEADLLHAAEPLPA